jgi:hypothetical protein
MTKHDLQEKLEAAIRETLNDPEGAGSDLSFIDDIGPGDEWLFVEGNLDIRHLASHVIDTLGLGEYEYAIEETKIGVGAVILDNQWTPYLDNAIATKERLVRFHRDNYLATTGKEWYSYKVVKRPKALPYVEVKEKGEE